MIALLSLRWNGFLTLGFGYFASSIRNVQLSDEADSGLSFLLVFSRILR